MHTWVHIHVIGNISSDRRRHTVALRRSTVILRFEKKGLCSTYHNKIEHKNLSFIYLDKVINLVWPQPEVITRSQYRCEKWGGHSYFRGGRGGHSLLKMLNLSKKQFLNFLGHVATSEWCEESQIAFVQYLNYIFSITLME